MADRIQLRRDTAANWTQYNPILLEGEPGIELDTDQWKMGDGVHTWSQLAYRGGPYVQQRGQSTTVAMSQKAVTDILNTRKFYLLGSATVETSQSGNAYRKITFSSVNIFDWQGGYRGINVNSREIDLHTTKNVYLSATEDTFTAPDLTTAGRGEMLYLVQQNYSAVHNDYLILGNNGFKFYDPFNLLNGDDIQKAVTPVNQRVTNLVSRIDNKLFYILGAAPIVQRDNANNISLTWTASNKPTIFDCKGGYRFIDAGVYSLTSAHSLYLSATENTFTAPDLTVRGTGETLYLKSLAYSDAGAFGNELNDYLVVANNGGQIYSPFSFINQGFVNEAINEKAIKRINEKLFYILGHITWTQDNNNIVLSIDSFSIFDYLGGYRFLAEGLTSFTLSDVTKCLYLSATEDTFTAPDLTVRGTGERLYLVEMSYGVTHNDYLVIGHNGNQFYDPYNLLEDYNIQKKVDILRCNLQFYILNSISDIKAGASRSIELSFSGPVINVFDYKGGYRNVNLPQDNKITLGNTYNLYLSATENTFTAPDLTTRGSGQTLYLVQEHYNNGQHNDYLVAANNGGVFYSPFFYKKYDSEISAINTRFKTRQFYILGNATISTIAGSNKRLFNISQAAIFDYQGGYRFFPQDFEGIEFATTNNIYLSADPDTFVAPDLSVAGRGERLYLIAMNYSAAHNDYLVLGNNGFKWYYDPFNLLDNQKIQEIVDEAISHVDVPQNLIKENNGILPSESFDKTPLSFDVFEHILKKDKDVTIIHLGDSISTNNYATGRSDQAYRPPRMDEWGLIPYIEDHLRWRGQQYRRADAKTEQDGDTNMFTEVGTHEDKFYDAAWDWQVDNLNQNYYRLWTRVLTGTAETPASVTFTIPAGTKRFAFIYRTDYLCADSTTVIMAANKARIIQADGTLVEANGYTFSAKEVDEVLTKTYTGYDGVQKTKQMRKSRGQVRLDFHVDNISSALTVTIQNVGAGRLNYWGVEYTPYGHIIRYINMARGGHNMSLLKCFEEWDVDAFKPDLIVYQCPIINEGAMSVVVSNTPNTPPVFAQRFVDRFTELKQKQYTPEVLSYILYIGVQANIVNQDTGKYQCSTITGYGYVDTYKYIGVLEEALKTANLDIVNCFNRFDGIAYRKAELEGTNNIWTSAIVGSGGSGNTFTQDNVHFNNYGSLIAWRLLKKYFNV